ncbi:MAG: hypothetical protein L3J23_04755 [Flavobacteriaceae bacterium]|nr:hypothetical protein [Flavobacteriaceae bacterium]
MRGMIFSAIFFAFSLSAYACSCEELSTKEAFKKSDLIFAGKLIEKEIRTTEINAPKIKTKQHYTRVIFTFEVIELIKGLEKSKIITISSKRNGIDFKRGHKYLIYAYYSEYLLTSNFYLNGEKVSPFLVTDVCTKTKQLDLIQKNEIKKLKKIVKRRKNYI